MNDNRSARLAILIDADNASAKIADALFEEIAKIGEASVRRIYGDFASPRMKGWTEMLARHAIIPLQQFAYTTGKNASDITLVIDAMDLLHSGRFDGFCLVSSDSDFTRLASRIREEGLDVYGFGEQKTPESFRQACRRFIYTENLLPERVAPDARRGPAAAPLSPPSAVEPMLTRVIEQMETEDGWVNLGTFGKQLQNLYTDFDPRTFGHKKLSDLVRGSRLFAVDHPEGGSLRIRLKQAESGKPAAAPAAPVAPVVVAIAPARGRARTAAPRAIETTATVESAAAPVQGVQAAPMQEPAEPIRAPRATSATPRAAAGPRSAPRATAAKPVSDAASKPLTPATARTPAPVPQAASTPASPARESAKAATPPTAAIAKPSAPPSPSLAQKPVSAKAATPPAGPASALSVEKTAAPPIASQPTGEPAPAATPAEAPKPVRTHRPLGNPRS